MKVYLYEIFRDLRVKDGRGQVLTDARAWQALKVFATEAAAREFNRGLPEYYHGAETSGWRLREMEVES